MIVKYLIEGKKYGYTSNIQTFSIDELIGEYKNEESDNYKLVFNKSVDLEDFVVDKEKVYKEIKIIFTNEEVVIILTTEAELILSDRNL